MCACGVLKFYLYVLLEQSKCLWALLALHSHFPLPHSHFHSCCDSASNRPQSTMTPHWTQTHRQRKRRMRGKPLGGSERNFKGEINCRGTLHCESDMRSTPSRIWDLFLSVSLALTVSLAHTLALALSNLVMSQWYYFFCSLSHKTYTIMRKLIWKKNHKGHLYLISDS